MAAHLARSLLAATMGVAVLTSCGSGGVAAMGNGCSDADQGILDGVLTTARHDFTFGDSTIAKLEFVRASVVELPEADREFGVTSILAIRSAWHVATAVSESFSVIRGTELIGIDEAGDVAVPLDDSAAAYEIDKPADSGFDDWVASLESQEIWNDAYSCVAS